MKLLNGGNVERIALDDIMVEDRLRAVRENYVDNLVLMAEETGITTPIQVRRMPKGGGYRLIDGGHRLEAARRLGLPDIAAILFECSERAARAMEVSNNLGAARMTPLQTAVFVASWKKDYYARHPERRAGVFKGNRHTGKLVTGILPLTRMIADAFGVDDTTVHRAMSAGERLEPEDVARLEALDTRIPMDHLKALSKVLDAEKRRAAIDMLEAGETRTLKQALTTVTKPHIRKKSATEEAHERLIAYWGRATKQAQRRFVRDYADEIRPLLDDLDVAA